MSDLDETQTLNIERATMIAHAAQPKFDILRVTGPTEIIRIDPEGRIFWKGREVETDADFREAMKELAQVMARRGR